MFSELMKLRELARLLRKKRYLEVLSLARDPEIRDHRRAVVAAEKAREALMKEAECKKAVGELTQAFQSIRGVLSDHEEAGARRLEDEIRKAMGDRQEREVALDAEVDRALALAEAGDLGAGMAHLEPLAAEHRGAQEALKDLVKRRDGLEIGARRARDAMARKDLASAREACAELRELAIAAPVTISLTADLLLQIAKGEDTGRLAGVLDETRSMRDGEGSSLLAARRKAASKLLARTGKALKAGEVSNARLWLGIWPLGVEGDDLAASWVKGLRLLDRAKRMDRMGDRALAIRLGEEARGALRGMPAARDFLDGVARRETEARGPIEDARRALGSGRLIAARIALVSLLAKQPRHREGLDLLHTVEVQDREDQAALASARMHLRSSESPQLAEARRVLNGLSARRPDLEDVTVLLRDVSRRSQEQGSDAESRGSSLDDSQLASTLPGALGDPSWLGDRKIVFRSADDLQGAGSLAGGLPFVLRVEEQGDWYAHPADTLIIGNATGDVAHLPILASIGTRHARIERSGRGPHAEYRLVPVPGRKTSRNRRPVNGSTELRHGDVIGLGSALSLTFLRPVPENGTAVLELSGDFTVAGCRRVLLFCEGGRSGAVVVGPGPEAHVATPADRERVELLRGLEGDQAGRLLARSPRGVSVADGGERPQVKVRPGLPVRAGRLAFFVDPL